MQHEVGRGAEVGAEVGADGGAGGGADARRRGAGRRSSLWGAFGLLVAGALGAPRADAATLAAGFQEVAVLRDLKKPTAVRFAPDGRIFVAEKEGTIKVYDGLSDATPELVADLSAAVHSYWDRGLLGLAVHPDFPRTPWLYVLYTYDAPPGKTAPFWNDRCEDGTGKGCAVTARLARLEIGPDGKARGAEAVLLESGLCNQFPSHSIGDLAFGPDGALYLSAGDGASFSKTDSGSLGDPPNPCGDPTGEGGAFRAQDLLSPGDPVSYAGTVLRLDPTTGAARAGNPFAATPAADDDPVIAFGLRNPFRIAFRPGTTELWVGDVGGGKFEELNRIAAVGDGAVENFGWPCYEGGAKNASYEKLGLCPSLYAGPAVGAYTPPHFAYDHKRPPDAASCGGTTSTQAAVSGLAFYAGAGYPASYQGALFFSDYSRGCIWAMLPGAGGAPDPAQVVTIASGLKKPVSLQAGPDGDLFWLELGGTLRRLRHQAGNRAPVAKLAASATSGAPPLAVTFDPAGTADPDGDPVTYAWDLDGDGTFEQSAAGKVVHTYGRAGTFTAALRASDPAGLSSTATVTVVVGNSPPVATIGAPAAGARFRVGETVTFAGAGSDPEDGALPAARLSWALVLHHCGAGGDGDCHAHDLESWSGVDGASFKWPEHEGLSHLELRLTVTDAAGLEATASRRLDPRVAALSFTTSPPGLSILVDGEPRVTPLELRVVAGTTLPLEAPEAQAHAAGAQRFASWSDGAPRVRTIVAPDDGAAIVATYAAAPAAPASPGTPDAGAPPAAPPEPSHPGHAHGGTPDAGAPPAAPPGPSHPGHAHAGTPDAAAPPGPGAPQTGHAHPAAPDAGAAAAGASPAAGGGATSPPAAAGPPPDGAPAGDGRAGEGPGASTGVPTGAPSGVPTGAPSGPSSGASSGPSAPPAAGAGAAGRDAGAPPGTPAPAPPAPEAERAGSAREARARASGSCAVAPGARPIGGGLLPLALGAALLAARAGGRLRRRSRAGARPAAPAGGTSGGPRADA